LDQKADGGSVWREAKASSQAATPSKVISDKLSDLTRAEEDAWLHAPNVPVEVRPIYLAHLTLINSQKQFLAALE
ncbi:hypothetical protein, partial [Falsiruegeria mediterranea]